MTGCQFGFRSAAALVIMMISAAAYLAPFRGSLNAMASAAPLHVMVDPGHGGSDKGASRGTLKESELALRISLKLAENLRSDPRFRVSLTRTTDRKVSLAQRTQMAETAKADLFISLHLNSSTDPRAHGMEIYFQNQLPADEESMFLVSREHEEDEAPGDGVSRLTSKTDSRSEPISGRTDLKRILEDLQRNHRIQTSSELSKILHESLVKNDMTQKSAQPGTQKTAQKIGSRAIRQAPFQVVSHTHVPAVLVEIGFISHAHEGPRLADSEYQKHLARGLFDGLVKFKEFVDNQGRENLKSQASAAPLK